MQVERQVAYLVIHAGQQAEEDRTRLHSYAEMQQHCQLCREVQQSILL